jgi:phage protein U
MTDSTVMMALGDFRFSISTAAYQSLERTDEWRWPAVERIGVAPARQFVGPGDTKITMSGKIYPSFQPARGGLAQMSTMRAQADLGTPLLMVDGNGRIWGDFVIESLKETQTVFFSDGTPRCIEFEITLGAYGDE